MDQPLRGRAGQTILKGGAFKAEPRIGGQEKRGLDTIDDASASGLIGMLLCQAGGGDGGLIGDRIAKALAPVAGG